MNTAIQSSGTGLRPEVAHFQAHFERHENEVFGLEPSWLISLRRAAIARFTEVGFPTLKDEEWRYTNVRPIAEVSFRPAMSGTGALSADDLHEILSGAPGCRLVFLNGKYAPELSTANRLPKGVIAGSLAQQWTTNPQLLEGHLAQYARYLNNPFVALNTALMEDGAFMQIARGIVIEEPIYLLFIATRPQEPMVIHPRNLIVMEQSSQAKIVEKYVGLYGQAGEESCSTTTGVCPYLTNVVTEIVAAPNAILDHYKLQRESESAFHVATIQIQLAGDCTFSSHAISFGGALVRNDINAVLSGEGIECTLNGLNMATGHQHVDTHTLIDHALPRCTSHELYKTILDGHATGVFNGKILVRPNAQKTDAKQTNQNLLLSEDALINTKPQLEIFADDVRCTHGATVGQLDEDAIFYLRTRGVGLEEARNLLTYAFAS
ncbi:MAG TPA: Fe-S cluster assembly protein SufD, partial [Chthonomonadales bacterium]|nr:Fe-S cluster assembly protein SufD [Chthonomonadales bacterium]